MNDFNRRTFLQTTAAGALLSTMPTAFGDSSGDASGSVAPGEGLMEFGERASKSELGPKMKLSLAAYSFSKLMKRYPTFEELPQMQSNLVEVIDVAAELNLDGVELTGYYVPGAAQEIQTHFMGETQGSFFEAPPERANYYHRTAVERYLRSLSARAFRLGLDVSGTAIGNDFCLPEGGQRAEQIANCIQWCKFASFMGAPVIRIFAGKVPKGDSEEAALERCIDGIVECLPAAASVGVCLALENHGGITAEADTLLRIVDGVLEKTDHPDYFGVNFDSGNFKNDDPYGELAKIAPYAINAQIKDYIAPNGKKGEPDLDRVVGILKDANYRGYVVMEYEGHGDPRTEVPQWVEKLRKAIG
ncbi:sugar phosphate isomerase/epimerase family protein [Stratiformator vulcanicus]|uniref:Xylose isomerase-like TIM barrel n=1 Tax=Stratiformator vulcanicus TaxID=2527980 RepID=A0A517QZC3_9PLAN|nr:sugar phosphate isomerase/epimerase family protein [Stratiformator vulcanicus]QDT36958.1 Xylose isomerase-like TIM barrel [Stratiformator vulcanicus]